MLQTQIIMDYKAPDNIYWLFSSSAQAIAAFIGFLAAGFFFVYDSIDKQVEKDETLEEIYADIKIQYYRRLKILFILTGLSVILSLLVVFLNGYDLHWFGLILQSLTALLNILTIGWAIWFVIFIIDPDKVKRTAQKLIEENKEVFEPKGRDSLSRGEYLDKFAALEKLLRAIGTRYELVTDRQGRFRNFFPIEMIIRGLYQRQLINPQQLKDLSAANRIRHLAAHGEIEQIELKQGNIVDELVKQLKKYNEA
jgi:hypothetical protein